VYVRPFEEDFKLLNHTLQEMGALVARSIHRSVFSFVEKNEDFAHQVIRDEARVDQLEIQIDDLATSLIVRDQPVASDMRLIVSAIKISTDLERMGDLAVNIVERSLALIKLPPLPEPVDFNGLTGTVEHMVLGALDAFTKRDANLAREIVAADDAVDQMRAAIYQNVIDLMMREPGCIPRAQDHLAIARSLERIADHATNIAEDVIFLAQGIDVRHRQMETAATL
jgi:phosphate transport system protein